MYKLTPLFLNKIILFALIITPIFTFGELLTLLNYNNCLIFSTPLLVKGIKDITFLLLIFILIIFILKKMSINKLSFFSLYSIIFILSISLFSLNYFLVYFSGIRWLMPFILASFLITYINENLLKQISKILAYLLIFTFVVQCFQFLSIEPNYGEIFYRTNGFFESPTTNGFFIVVSFFFNYFYGSYKLRKVLLFLTPVGLYLSFSKTGIIVYFLIILISNYYDNLVKIIVYIMIILLIFLMFILMLVPDAIFISLSARIDSFIDALEKSYFLPVDFGLATNTFILFQQLIGDNAQISSDSFLTSLLVNLGVLLFIVALIIYCLLMYYSYISRNKSFTIFLLIYGLFGLTISITEAYPMNLLFSVLLAYNLSKIKFRLS